MPKKRKVGVIVAHPDDETLWAGGLILLHPDWDFHIYSLCRASDPDRSIKFFKVLKYLHASGNIADLDDAPEQLPLDEGDIRSKITLLVDNNQFDLLITHGLNGEYTRHLRHEETAKTVTTLWVERKIKAGELWLFAYEDGQGNYLPKAKKDADITIELPVDIWLKKHRIITQIYGFGLSSWEAQVTPKIESFWQYHSISDFLNKNKRYEGIGVI